MISAYKDSVKDALYGGGASCTKANGIVSVAPVGEWQADRIRRLRTSLYLSQSLFGALFGVNLGTVASWENGSSHPSAAVRRLMDMLSKDPDILLDQQIVQIHEPAPPERKVRKVRHSRAHSHGLSWMEDGV